MVLDKTTKRRLLKLCDYMATLPRKANEHFDMRRYINHRGLDHEHPAPKTKADLMTCGTTACALGWATTMPYFRRLGLVWSGYGGVTGDEGIFTITDEQWDALFEGHNLDPTPKAWARRARKLIKAWSA